MNRLNERVPTGSPAWSSFPNAFAATPQIDALRQGLRNRLAEAYLFQLWGWAKQHGDIQGGPSPVTAIETNVGWRGKRGRFVEVAAQLGFIVQHPDGTLQVVPWWDVIKVEWSHPPAEAVTPTGDVAGQEAARPQWRENQNEARRLAREAARLARSGGAVPGAVGAVPARSQRARVTETDPEKKTENTGEKQTNAGTREASGSTVADERGPEGSLFPGLDLIEGGKADGIKKPPKAKGPRSKAPPAFTGADRDRILAHFKQAFGAPNAVFKGAEGHALADALGHGRTIDELCQVITFCSMEDFHRKRAKALLFCLSDEAYDLATREGSKGKRPYPTGRININEAWANEPVGEYVRDATTGREIRAHEAAGINDAWANEPVGQIK
jgi:hypothetical protein